MKLDAVFAGAAWVGLLSGSIVACGGTSAAAADPAAAAGSSKGDCDAITRACHKKDDGSGDVHVCHEAAHQGTDAGYCTENKSRCVALCDAAATLGAGTRGGGHPDGHSHGDSN